MKDHQLRDKVKRLTWSISDLTQGLHKVFGEIIYRSHQEGINPRSEIVDMYELLDEIRKELIELKKEF